MTENPKEFREIIVTDEDDSPYIYDQESLRLEDEEFEKSLILIGYTEDGLAIYSI